MHMYTMTWLSSMMKLSSILQHSRFMEIAVNLVYHYPYTTMVILSVLDEKKSYEDRKASGRNSKKLDYFLEKLMRLKKLMRAKKYYSWRPGSISLFSDFLN